LAGLKTISILFLVVLVALAGGSPVFATDGAFITLSPAAACPGEIVSVSGDFPLDTVDNFDGGIHIAMSSDPDGLVDNYKCRLLDTPLVCGFRVSESASCGRYTITVTLEYREDSLISQTLGSASATFDVAGSCCAAVGGCVQPVNTFALVAPWLAVIGLVGCVTAVAVVAKKREK
jgi:hypothetical protein